MCDISHLLGQLYDRLLHGREDDLCKVELGTIGTGLSFDPHQVGLVEWRCIIGHEEAVLVDSANRWERGIPHTRDIVHMHNASIGLINPVEGRPLWPGWSKAPYRHPHLRRAPNVSARHHVDLLPWRNIRENLALRVTHLGAFPDIKRIGRRKANMGAQTSVVSVLIHVTAHILPSISNSNATSRHHLYRPPRYHCRIPRSYHRSLF